MLEGSAAMDVDGAKFKSAGDSDGAASNVDGPFDTIEDHGMTIRRDLVLDQALDLAFDQAIFMVGEVSNDADADDAIHMATCPMQTDPQGHAMEGTAFTMADDFGHKYDLFDLAGLHSDDSGSDGGDMELDADTATYVDA